LVLVELLRELDFDIAVDRLVLFVSVDEVLFLRDMLADAFFLSLLKRIL